MTRLKGATLAAAMIALATMVAGGAGASAPAALAAPAAKVTIAAPVHRGALRIAGTFRDGSTVTAAGLSWHASKLPAGWKLVSLAIAYTWQSCARGGSQCKAAADTTTTPFAARGYVVGHADAGRVLRLTETATEVVVPSGASDDFTDVQSSVTWLSAAVVAAYRSGQAPVTAFVNGTPERRTASTEEYFQVAAPHASAADGAVTQWYRIDGGRWAAMPASRVFYTGKLAVGPHQVTVRTANRAGATTIRFSWRVIPLPAPVSCRTSRQGKGGTGGCWYPQHLDAAGQPMSWDWQIGRVTPLQRTGAAAVDMYDLDGFLTTKAEVTAIKTTWRAATLAHPKTICYLDLAWEDYRPDATPGGGSFPASTLGQVYNGFPEERWVDFRQLDELKPMLDARISMCASKGFDAVELDDIDGFDPPSTTGFQLTPGDVQNYLAYAFNEVHKDGMTALWKNSPYLSSWGRQYTEGAVVEECYVSQDCTAAQLQGSTQYGITCTSLQQPAPCGWTDFTTDKTGHQPTGKWVGEAEYTDDDYVCDPGRTCPTAREFSTFCQVVEKPSYGFAAVLFDSDLDGGTFYPCSDK
jgi:Glycoside-hydrolase family GH114